MKKLILLFVTVFAFQFSNGQYLMDIEIATPELEQRAEQKAEMLTKKLGLNGEQPLLVRNKILEFLVKQDEIIQSDLSKEEKTKNLKALKLNRLKEMQDILTQPQYDQLLEVEKNMREKRAMKMKKNK